MKISKFTLNYAYLLYYKCHKINPNCDGSYIDSPDWKKKHKKAIKNPINEIDKKCFQYALTFTLNHEEIKQYLQILQKLNLL